jgi:hypothetical protein
MGGTITTGCGGGVVGNGGNTTIVFAVATFDAKSNAIKYFIFSLLK